MLHDWTAQEKEYASRCTQIHPLEIQDEFVRVSSDLYYWRAKWVSALDRETKASAEKSRIWAEVYRRLRELKDNGVKTTETAIEACIEGDRSYRMAVETEQAATIDKAHVHSVIEAIQAKRDCLISLGSMMRQERDISIRERADRG